MAAKSISMAEMQLVSWFSGQIGVVESQQGKQVEKLTLSIDRTSGDEMSILLTFKEEPVVPAEPE